MSDRAERTAVESEITNWLHGMADHTDNDHDRSLMLMIAEMIGNREYEEAPAPAKQSEMIADTDPPF